MAKPKPGDRIREMRKDQPATRQLLAIFRAWSNYVRSEYGNEAMLLVLTFRQAVVDFLMEPDTCRDLKKDPTGSERKSAYDLIFTKPDGPHTQGLKALIVEASLEHGHIPMSDHPKMNDLGKRFRSRGEKYVSSIAND